ncbi:MAG: transcription termination factor NusA [Candidatus Uhrbacteria bacterium]|nr:transcription termination factor NusA [Patescibacteria group bacterium]
MPSPIEQAIRQICDEKGLSYEAVLETIESALAAAFRKDFGDKNQNIEVEFDPETAGVRAFDVKTVVADVAPEELEATEEERKAKIAEREEQMSELKEKGQEIPPELEEPIEVEGPTFNPKSEIMISEAKEVDPDIELDQVLRQALEVPGEFGRMAAMTAKQVITQKLREAEREVLYSEFKELENEVINGTVQRREGRVILVDLGRVAGVVRPDDQISTERYNSGDRLKFFVRQVALTTKGPEILLSRTSEELVRRLFELEIPEVAEGSVEIKALAREPGSRTKLAVFTGDESIDPIGACIGQRGSRIQTIISELGGEKIDIIEWNDDVEDFISNALSPAKVKSIKLDEEEKSAVATVDADQLSLAIGKGGQNVRLAARLTGWKINVTEADKPVEEEAVPPTKDEAGSRQEDDGGKEAPVEEAPAADTPVEEITKEPSVAEASEDKEE